MELSQLCEELFCQTGQIGYYLLRCQLTQKEEEIQGGAVPALERHHSAKPGL